MPKYTFTFEKEGEKRFNQVLERLDPDEYTIIKETHFVDPKDQRYSKRETIIEMDSEACLTFRMSMGNDIKIRRERTEEELAEEKALEEKNTVKVTVIVPPDDVK